MDSYNIYHLCLAFSHSIIPVAIIHIICFNGYSLLLSSIYLWGYSTCCLPIYLLMDRWSLFPSFGRIINKTAIIIYMQVLVRNCIFISLEYKVWIVGPYDQSIFNLVKSCLLFSKVWPFILSLVVWWRVTIVLSSCQHLALSVIYRLAILVCFSAISL